VALPSEVRVKISSEAAGSIAITEVSVQSLPVRNLVEQMLGLTGKGASRIQEILKRGSFVAGESRLRWQGFDASAADLAPVLATFPDPEPGRPFDPSRCFHVVLLAGCERLDLSLKVAAKRSLFRRRSLWDELMSLGALASYVEYSYKLRCDRYRTRMDLGQLAKLHAKKVDRTAYDTAEFYVSRL
jgi:hypothetical protein